MNEKKEEEERGRKTCTNLKNWKKSQLKKKSTGRPLKNRNRRKRWKRKPETFEKMANFMGFVTGAVNISLVCYI